MDAERPRLEEIAAKMEGMSERPETGITMEVPGSSTEPYGRGRIGSTRDSCGPMLKVAGGVRYRSVPYRWSTSSCSAERLRQMNQECPPADTRGTLT